MSIEDELKEVLFRANTVLTMGDQHTYQICEQRIECADGDAWETIISTVLAHGKTIDEVVADYKSKNMAADS